MLLSIALDGSKRRDLQFFQGDEVTITVAVYAEDGDTEAVTVTDPRFVWPTDGGFAYGAEFAVSDANVGRSYYRIVGEIAGVTTTLAHGYIRVEGKYSGCGCWPRSDYGFCR
jgi:hypothetical protein